MNITPIPGEQGRFFVDSTSRPNVTFIVDLLWRPERRSKPVPQCTCEDALCRSNRYCKHVVAVIERELGNQTGTKGSK